MSVKDLSTMSSFDGRHQLRAAVGQCGPELEDLAAGYAEDIRITVH
jgi:hypothetical protein